MEIVGKGWVWRSIPSAMSEKKAPNQSMARKTKSKCLG